MVNAYYNIHVVTIDDCTGYETQVYKYYVNLVETKILSTSSACFSLCLDCTLDKTC